MGIARTYLGDADALTPHSREKEIQEMTGIIESRRRYFQLIAVRRLGGNDADAEDALQDAFLSAWTHIDQFRGSAQIATWLTTIVTNSARMKARRRRGEGRIFFDLEDSKQANQTLLEWLPDHRPGPEELCRARELMELIDESSRQLSLAFQQSIKLRQFEGLSNREAALVLGVKESTMKVRTSRARSKLKQLMRERVRSKRGSNEA